MPGMAGMAAAAGGGNAPSKYAQLLGPALERALKPTLDPMLPCFSARLIFSPVPAAADAEGLAATPAKNGFSGTVPAAAPAAALSTPALSRVEGDALTPMSATEQWKLRRRLRLTVGPQTSIMQVAQGLSGQAALFTGGATAAAAASAASQGEQIVGFGGGVEPAVVMLDEDNNIEGVLTAAELVGFVGHKLRLDPKQQLEQHTAQHLQPGPQFQPSPVLEHGEGHHQEEEKEEEEEEEEEEEQQQEEDLEKSVEDRQGMLYENLVSELKGRHSGEKGKKKAKTIAEKTAAIAKARLKENSPTGGNISGAVPIRTKLVFGESVDQATAAASSSISELFASSVKDARTNSSAVATAADGAGSVADDVQSIYRCLLGGEACAALVRRCGVAVLAKDGPSSRVLDVLHKLTDFGGSDSGGEHVVVLMKADAANSKSHPQAAAEEGSVLAVVEPLQLLRAVAELVGSSGQGTGKAKEGGREESSTVVNRARSDSSSSVGVGAVDGVGRGQSGRTIGTGRARVQGTRVQGVSSLQGRVRRPSESVSSSQQVPAGLQRSVSDAPGAKAASAAAVGGGGNGQLGLFGEVSSLQSEGSLRNSWELELLGEDVMLECDQGPQAQVLIAPPPATPFATTGGGNKSKVHVFKCKIRFQENLHRLSLPLPYHGECAGCVAALLQAVVGKGLKPRCNNNKLQVLQIKCTDDDGDEVMISSDEALRELLEMAKKGNMKTVNFNFTLSDFSPCSISSSNTSSVLTIGETRITYEQATQLAAVAGLLGAVAIAAVYLLRRRL
jgi:hypothetical protein